MEHRLFFALVLTDQRVNDVQSHAVPQRNPIVDDRANQNLRHRGGQAIGVVLEAKCVIDAAHGQTDRKSTRLNSSHGYISYAVFCLKKKKKKNENNSAHDCLTMQPALRV